MPADGGHGDVTTSVGHGRTAGHGLLGQRLGKPEKLLAPLTRSGDRPEGPWGTL